MKEDVFTQNIQGETRIKWYQKWWVILLIILLALILFFIFGFIGLVYYYKGNIENGLFIDPATGEITNTLTIAPSSIQGSAQDISIDDDPTLGSLSAKVTIVMFEDFECPFCQKVQSNFKDLRREYGDTILFVSRDFPLVGTHANAQTAAEASECADDQGKYWEYHDLLYANQLRLDTVSLEQYASTLGLDTTEFSTCLESGKHEEEVKNDLRDALAYGVDATPTWYINGVRYRGILTYEILKAIVDVEIKNSK